nr:hypothetical protein Iba_scaffold2905CG0060 [Ipomoea batatas]
MYRVSCLPVKCSNTHKPCPKTMLDLVHLHTSSYCGCSAPAI